MKKIIICLLLLISCVTLSGCTSNKYSKLSYNSLVKKIENKETFILLFCDESNEGKLLKKTLNRVLNEYNIDAYIMNPTKLSQDEKNNLRNTMYVETNGILFIKNGVDSSKLAHLTDTYATKSEIITYLINNDFIDE